MKWLFALVYLDDVVISSKSHEHHIDHMGKFLTLLEYSGATHNLTKCQFDKDEIEYFRQVTHSIHLEIALQTTDYIRKIRVPIKLLEIMSFPKLCNIFRQLFSNIE